MENQATENVAKRIKPWKPLACMIALLGICILTTAPTLSKWVSQNKGVSNVEVAIFAADAGSSDDAELKLDQTQDITEASYTFWVSNTEDTAISEVNSEYSVIITLPTALPDGMTMLVDNTTGTKSADGKTYTYENANWTLNAGNTDTNNHTLTFKADFDTVKDDLSLDGIKIKVKVSQKN